MEMPPQNIVRDKKKVYCGIIVTRLAVRLMVFTVTAAVKRIVQRISLETSVYGDHCACQIHPIQQRGSKAHGVAPDRRAPIKKRARLLGPETHTVSNVRQSFKDAPA